MWALKGIAFSFNHHFFCGWIKKVWCFLPFNYFSFLLIINYNLIQINLNYCLNIHNRSSEAAKAFLCRWDRRQNFQASESSFWNNKNSCYHPRNPRNYPHLKIPCSNQFYSNHLSIYRLILPHHFSQSCSLTWSDFVLQKELEIKEIFFHHSNIRWNSVLILLVEFCFEW